MKRKNLIALIGACTCAIGLMLIAFPSPSVNAEQPPRNGCRGGCSAFTDGEGNAISINPIAQVQAPIRAMRFFRFIRWPLAFAKAIFSDRNYPNAGSTDLALFEARSRQRY